MDIINKASEKYKGFQDEICTPLFELLREINALEKEAVKRETEIQVNKDKNGVSQSVYTDDDRALSDYVRAEMKSIVTPARFSDKLLKRGYCISWREPQTYGYIDEECEATFSMRNAARAAVEIRDTAKISNQFKFVYRLIDDKWLLDEVYWRSGSNSNWSATGIK